MVEQKIMKKVGEMKIEYKFGACPDCGDTLFEYELDVYNHGKKQKLVLAWCMDCLDIKGYLLMA